MKSIQIEIFSDFFQQQYFSHLPFFFFENFIYFFIGKFCLFFFNEYFVLRVRK